MSVLLFVLPRGVAAILAGVSLGLTLANLVSYQKVLPSNVNCQEGYAPSEACTLWPAVLAAYVLSAVSSANLLLCCIVASVQGWSQGASQKKKANIAIVVLSGFSLVLYVVFLVLVATAAHVDIIIAYGGWNSYATYGQPPGSGLDYAPKDFVYRAEGASGIQNGPVVAPGMIAAGVSIASALFAMMSTSQQLSTLKTTTSDAEWEAEWEKKNVQTYG